MDQVQQIYAALIIIIGVAIVMGIFLYYTRYLLIGKYWNLKNEHFSRNKKIHVAILKKLMPGHFLFLIIYDNIEYLVMCNHYHSNIISTKKIEPNDTTKDTQAPTNTEKSKTMQDANIILEETKNTPRETQSSANPVDTNSKSQAPEQNSWFGMQNEAEKPPQQEHKDPLSSFDNYTSDTKDYGLNSQDDAPNSEDKTKNYLNQ